MAATAAPARAPHAAPPWLAAATAASCSSTRRATKAVPLRTDASGLDGAACSCSHTAAAAFAAERRWSWSRGGAMRQRPLLPVQAWRSDPAASREMLMLATMLEAADSELLHTQQEEGEEVESHGGEDQESTALAVWARKCVRAAAVPAALVLAASSWQQLPAHATELGGGNPAYGEVGAVLELGVQLIYLGLLLLFLGVGTFLVVRQVLVRRELESAAKELQVSQSARQAGNAAWIHSFIRSFIHGLLAVFSFLSAQEASACSNKCRLLCILHLFQQACGAARGPSWLALANPGPACSECRKECAPGRPRRRSTTSWEPFSCGRSSTRRPTSTWSRPSRSGTAMTKTWHRCIMACCLHRWLAGRPA